MAVKSPNSPIFPLPYNCAIRQFCRNHVKPLSNYQASNLIYDNLPFIPMQCNLDMESTFIRAQNAHMHFIQACITNYIQYFSQNVVFMMSDNNSIPHSFHFITAYSLLYYCTFVNIVNIASYYYSDLEQSLQRSCIKINLLNMMR